LEAKDDRYFFGAEWHLQDFSDSFGKSDRQVLTVPFRYLLRAINGSRHDYPFKWIFGPQIRETIQSKEESDGCRFNRVIAS
jgi:hypothetical protein